MPALQCSALKVPLSCCADNFYTDPPGPVNNLQVASTTATSLRIAWVVSGFIDRFEVTYSYTVKRCPAPQGEPRTDTIFDGTMRSHTLRGLNEDSSYTITVRAINIAGTRMVTSMAETGQSGKNLTNYRNSGGICSYSSAARLRVKVDRAGVQVGRARVKVGRARVKVGSRALNL